MDIEVPETYCFIQRSGANINVKVRFPQTGPYILRLFAKTGNDDNIFNWACDYIINNTNNNSLNKKFPKQYASFFQQNVFIETPLDLALPVNSLQHFKVKIDNAIEAAVVMNDLIFPLIKGSDFFEGNIHILPGEIKLVAKFDDSENYHWLVQDEGQ